MHYVPSLGFWFLTRYDDVKRLFNDPENATMDRRVWERFEPRPAGSMLRWFDDTGLQAQGAADHARVRRIVAAAFTPRALRRMDDQIREVVERFAAPLRERSGGVVDFLGEFTNLIPIAVISRLTGVPPAGDDEARFRDLAQVVVRAFFPFTPPHVVDQAEEALGELTPWVREMTAERRARPRADLVSDLVRAQDRDDRLTDDEIVLLLTGILAAGSETTAIGGLNVIKAMLGQPGAMKRVRDDRSLVPNAINEIMRFAFGGPGGPTRYAVRDFELRGRKIRRGQMLMLSFVGANRDPAVFDDPDRFDLDREARDLLVFGKGPHFCLGANLARQEMGCMLDAALDIAGPGSFVREDLCRFEDLGIYQRPLNLPVEIPAG